MTKAINRGISVSIAAMLLGAAPAVFAQEKPSSNGANDEAPVGEIIVTAQRRAENVQKVPISIAVVSGDTLVSQGVMSSDGIQRLAPGLSMSTVGTGFVSYTYMRGGGTNQIDPGSDPSVAFFVDEVYITGASGLQFDLFDIDHVEVLKGPQGTLFGRNAASGAISIVTKRPSSTFGGNAHLEYGEYNSLLARASVTGPLTSDGALSFRLSGAYRSQDAFTKNLTGGKDPGDVDSGGARGQLQYKSGPLTILLAGDYFKARNGQTNQFISSANVAALVDPTLPQPTNQSFYAHYYNLIGYENQDVYNLSGRIELETGIGTITSVSAYRHNKFKRRQDQDGTLYDSFDLFSSEKDKTFSQELRIVGDAANDKVHYVAGVYYYDGEIDSVFVVKAGPAFPNAGFRGRTSTDSRTLSTKSYAAFGQLTYDLTDQFGVTIGGRWTKDKKDDDRAVSIFGLINYTATPKKSWTAFTPSATLNFKPTEDVLTYFSYRRGFKSGGFQALLASSATVANIPFNPEKVDSYEFGVKATLLDRTLTANLALFRSDITDQQVSRTISATQIYIDNAGETRAEGLDFEFVARPSRRLTVTASGTYQKAKFRKFQSGAISYKGKHQLRSPDFAGYFAIDYRMPLGDFGDLALHADYSERSEQFYDLANTKLPGLYSPAYGVGNLRATLEPSALPIKISAFVKNVGNKHYYQNIAANGQSGLAVPGAPRVFGGAIDFEF